ncbi:hypothetical protein LO763_15575 [Glycomyces sp. A-F 0318]|uniref:hypothetical protein n=1 Tax=Glycomyces amatae TaxID=2881355 RepID=UPI001E396324|nr:hypothetical protein [Glycomyces amatae]MCD0445036.1 hypothetical protein [Glycomyces amatae]
MANGRVIAPNVQATSALSTEDRDLERLATALPLTAVSIETGDEPVPVGLISDSESLHARLREHWKCTTAKPRSTVVALAAPAASHQLDERLDQGRYWRPGGSQLWMTAATSYTEVKVAVRGLASFSAGAGVLFAHGCALSLGIDGRRHGVLVMGSSGAGKTTLVSSVKHDGGLEPRIVNDDWGPVGLDGAVAHYTGELKLHMKAQSILAFNSAYEFPRTPAPSDRLLVDPFSVFGEDVPASATALRHVIFIIRNRGERPGVLEGRVDLDWLARGQYSPFYDANEPFLNGSLLLRDERRIEIERQKYRRLLDSCRVGLINNTGTPDQLKRWFLQILGG